MEHTPNAPHLREDFGTGMTQRKKASDYIYPVATVVAALLLLLTAAV
jgi:hypothetical protein